jgi:NAD(P)-dependent dehydrogenase (short-subunit alcohol dehydrogenase family)
MHIDTNLAAIVTGGASGLGEATSRMLAGHGVKVAIFDVQSERGKALANEIGGLFQHVDVTDDTSVATGIKAASTAHGVARILVNCAGVASGRRVVSTKRDTGERIAHDMATFSRTIEINLIGTFRMIAACAQAMSGLEPITQDGGRGVIISTASIAASDGQIGQAAYSASKGGVVGLTLPVARDLASYGIRVMTIMPGLFETPMFDTITQDFRIALEASVPFPSRLGKPAEYAALVRHIIENDMLNGETIRLDGAVRLSPR